MHAADRLGGQHACDGSAESLRFMNSNGSLQWQDHLCWAICTLSPVLGGSVFHCMRFGRLCVFSETDSENTQLYGAIAETQTAHAAKGIASHTHACITQRCMQCANRCKRGGGRGERSTPGHFKMKVLSLPCLTKTSSISSGLRSMRHHPPIGPQLTLNASVLCLSNIVSNSKSCLTKSIALPTSGRPASTACMQSAIRKQGLAGSGTCPRLCQWYDLTGTVQTVVCSCCLGTSLYIQ